MLYVRVFTLPQGTENYLTFDDSFILTINKTESAVSLQDGTRNTLVIVKDVDATQYRVIDVSYTQHI